MFDKIMNMPWILNVPAEFWILHIRYLTGSEYASSSEYTSVTQGSVENGPPFSSGSQYIGCEYAKVTQGSL